MRKLSILIFFISLQFEVFSQSDTLISSMWVTNAAVNSIVTAGSKVYLGGDFTHIGPSVTYGVPLEASTGLPNTAYAKPDGAVKAVIPDGSGGWYIGGDFTAVGGVARNRLARINSDGTLNSWNQGTSNTVHCLALSGGILYVGGSFTSAGGSTRNRIAAFNASTGALTSWNPNASATVYAIAVSGTTVYAGGSFTTIGGQSRSRIAALDATQDASNATSWNPTANTTVFSLAIGGGVLYVGGAFTSFVISGTTTTRLRIAAFDVSTGSLTAWNPSTSSGGTVYALAVNGNTVYAAGAFTSIGGQFRNRIAALDATVNTSNATVWNPNADNTVNSLLVSGSTVYAGGDFANIGGQARPRIAALDATSGSATSWNPKAGSTVSAMALQNGYLYAGGSFTIIGGEVRNGVAAIDPSTGQASSWDPNVNGSVNAMAMLGGKLYVAGDFTTVGGQTRNNIASVDTTSGAISTWNPNANNIIYALAVTNDTVYAGGNFTSIGGQTRNRVAALSATDGTAYASWNANVSATVRALAVSGSTVYIGGDFTGATAINGNVTRNYIAAVNASDGLVTSWNPNASGGEVWAITVYNGLVYVAGNCTGFTKSPSPTVTRNYLAALDPTTGVPTAWNPNPANTVSTMTFSGKMAYVGRGFNSIGGSSRTNAAGLLLDVSTGNATAWNPKPGNYVYCIAQDANNVYLGGGFSTVDGQLRNNFAAFPKTTVDWSGSAGGNWSDASNWAQGYAPSSSLDVAITTGYPTLDADYTVPSGKSLTISGTGSMRVAAGKRLTIAGTANFGGKSVTLQSTSAGTASIGQVTGTLTGATNVTVERYIPAGRKWRMLSAPLTGSSNNSIFYNWQNNGTVTAATGVEVWGAGGSSNPSTGNGLQTGSNPSIRSYDAGGWQNVTNTKTTELFNASTNNGYAVFVAGSFKNGASVVSPSQPAEATTLSATGTLITGDHTKNLTAATAGQYFLVANPYASPVNPSSFTDAGTVNRTNLDNTLYMWDAKPGIGTGNGLGRYVSYDIAAGVYSNTGAGTGYADNTVQIQSGQAFFVRATNAGAASLVFRESSKGGTSSHEMLGNANISKRQSVQIQLQASGELLDGAMAIFHAGASASKDAFDGVKLLNSSENLGLLREGRTLVFEHRPFLKDSDTLQIILSQMQQRDYRLRIHGNGFTPDDNIQVGLFDRHLQKSRVLSLQDTTDIDFTVGAETATADQRFLITFSRKSSGGATSDPEEMVRMKPYPNPLTGGSMVRVNVDGSKGPWDMRLLDLSGKILWKRIIRDIHQQQVEINMSRHGAGVYQLLMTDGKGEQTVSQIHKQ